MSPGVSLLPRAIPRVVVPVQWKGREFGYAELIELAGMGNVPPQLRAKCAEAVAWMKLTEDMKFNRR